MTAKVIVSGGTGFIAQHILEQLLNHNYNIVTTVRSQAKGDHLLQLFNSPSTLSYEIVEDVGKPGAFDQVLQKNQDATVFLHTASPFHFKATDIAKELLEPAVEGTKNALKAIQKYGKNIKNVVITSSFAAVGTASKTTDPNYTFTEQDWNEIKWDEAVQNAVSGYRGSKTFAERAAWDFIKENDSQFSLTTVNPGFTFGPQLFTSEVKDQLNTSSEVINSILKLKPTDSIPTFRGTWVDVRDVAKAHVVAFENPKAKNERLILTAGSFTEQSIVDLINAKFPDLNLPKGEPGTDEQVIKEKLATVDNSKTRQILGFKFIDLGKSVIDSVQQILEAKKSRSGAL
ncbi:Gre2 protein [Candida orthopsilosis Co 90-125]|uniref:Gre2 protein n=1 Tax=Candida orthopsilosis (strain 90-125) TaxID=1136231 RepID=H8X8K3_CANO9|nr:Gre2 protein [Candida orthopsilosis Co 90-125]CCG24478.1 Gre2 protein [Candida orthopsilosis Co 90-125]